MLRFPELAEGRSLAVNHPVFRREQFPHAEKLFQRRHLDLAPDCQ